MTDKGTNVDALRTEFDQNKDAMGIRERNAAVLESWLNFVGGCYAVYAAVYRYLRGETDA